MLRKIVVLIILSLASNIVYSQKIEIQYDAETKKGFFQKVIEIKEQKASISYKKAIKWFAVTYKNSKEVIKSQIEGEYIKGTGINPNGAKIQGFKYNLMYNIELEIKDGKCRVTITNLYCKDGTMTLPVERYAFKSDGTRRTNEAWISTTNTIEESITNLVESLEKRLTSKEDEW
jgi:hypothetical protein